MSTKSIKPKNTLKESTSMRQEPTEWDTFFSSNESVSDDFGERVVDIEDDSISIFDADELNDNQKGTKHNLF